MKKIFIAAAFAVLAFTASAQTVDTRRKIEVSGVAEQEVIPDIIKVTISLKEYFKDKKKVTISQLEAQLQKALADAGVNKEDLSIDDLSASNWEERKKHLNFLASKQYIIKFKELTKYNQILGKLDAKGVESTEITDYDYSKITAVKKELKIKALLAARDKAEYLLNSVGEKLGGVLTISENDDFMSPYDNNRLALNVAQYRNEYSGSSDSNINFKTIKLRFQVSAVFEIK
jgi:uncharacterized protein YggE